MNLLPFEEMRPSTRDVIWRVITDAGRFEPKFYYILPERFSYDLQSMAYDWAKDNDKHLFISIALKMAVFETEADAVIFKLMWM